MARHPLDQHFGWPELVLTAQLETIHSFGFNKPQLTAHHKNSKVVSECASNLTQYGYESDIASVSVLNSTEKGKYLSSWKTRKRFYHLQKFDPTYKNNRMFSAWLNNIAEVQQNTRLQFKGNARSQAKQTTKRDKPTTTSLQTQRTPT